MLWSCKTEVRLVLHWISQAKVQISYFILDQQRLGKFVCEIVNVAGSKYFSDSAEHWSHCLTLHLHSQSSYQIWQWVCGMFWRIIWVSQVNILQSLVSSHQTSKDKIFFVLRMFWNSLIVWVWPLITQIWPYLSSLPSTNLDEQEARCLQII